MRSDKALCRPRIACYCRVSTREQLDGWSLDGQVDVCTEWCDRRFGAGGYDVEVFRDEGESGRKGIAEPGSRKGSFRPALTELVRRIAVGEFDVLIVSQLNRITRASRTWHTLLDKYIVAQRIEFISTKEALDTATAAGRLQASLLVDVAQYQAEEGAERVKMALRQRTEAGFPLGARPYGWTQTPADPEGRRRPSSMPVPEEAKWVRWMIEHYLDGWSYRRICDELMRLEVPAPGGGRLWHTGPTSKIILNPLHYGLIRQPDGEPTTGNHFSLRFFDPDVYDKLVKETASRKKFPTVTAACSDALLAGLVKRAACGERLFVVHPRGKYRGYRCLSWRPGAPHCESKPYVRGEFLEPRVIAEIEKVAMEPELQALALEEARRIMAESGSLHEEEIRELQDELQDIKRKQDRWQDLYLDDQMPREELKTKTLELAEKKARCEARIAEIKLERMEARNADDRLAEVRRILADFPAMWQAMNSDEKRHLLDLIIENLAVGQTDGVVRVRLKLALMPEVQFELPVVSAWRKRGGDGRRPKITLRQLALLDGLAAGKTFEDIQVKWRVGRRILLAMRNGALRAMSAETVEEAIEKARPMLAEWKQYLRSSGRYGASPDGPCVPRKLTASELELLRLMAAGWYERDIADHLKQPMTTVAGTRARIRDKMLSTSSEEAIARAVKAGIIGPDEPSPALLLRVYRDIADGKLERLVRRGVVKAPSQLQLAVLQDYAEGVQLQETAKRRGISNTAVTLARKRMWAAVGAVDLRSALAKVHELGMAELINQGVDAHEQT